MNKTKCQWTVVVRAQNRTHPCYHKAIVESGGQRYCRVHAKTAIRRTVKPGPERDAMIAGLPFGRNPFVPDPDGLTRRQRQIFDLLVKEAPRPVAVDDICRRAFGHDPIPDDRQLVRAHVCGLRARLGFDRIINVRGFGYQAVAS